MTPTQLLDACRCPPSLPTGDFGPWQVRRFAVDELETLQLREAVARTIAPYRSFVFLGRHTFETMMRPLGQGVMDDSPKELRRHLPILLRAHGRVLVSGLGLGCVVRGLLAKPEVSHVDVMEIDPTILRLIGPEFLGSPRVTLHHADARWKKWAEGLRWDFAWHDIWDEGDSWHVIHGQLLTRYAPRVPVQGAWLLPRTVARIWPLPLLNQRRRRRLALERAA